MLHDFLFKTLVWSMAFALALLMPAVFVSASWPEEQIGGRYARYWVRWFKRSVVWNVLGWSFTPVMLLAFFLTFVAFIEEEVERRVQQAIGTSATAVQTAKQVVERLEQQAQRSQEHVLAAEHAMQQRYDRQRPP